MDDDAEFVPVPPAPERVAARALVLASVAFRGLIEKDAAHADAEDLRRRCVDWLQRLDAVEEVEEREQMLLSKPLGTLTEPEAVNAGWRSEGLVVLGWALGWLELPRFDDECAPSECANALGFLDDRHKTPLANPKLRPPEEIEQKANEYLTYHWRLRQFRIKGEPMDFAEFVRTCRWGPLTVGAGELVEGDLAISGARLDRVPEGRFYATLSIVQERHQALNWLLGDDPVYSEVTTDT